MTTSRTSNAVEVYTKTLLLLVALFLASAMADSAMGEMRGWWRRKLTALEVDALQDGSAIVVWFDADAKEDRIGRYDAKGVMRWSRQLPGRASARRSAAVEAGPDFVAVRFTDPVGLGEWVRVLDLETGAERWTTQVRVFPLHERDSDGRSEAYARMLVTSRSLVVAIHDHALLELDRETGAIVRAIRVFTLGLQVKNGSLVDHELLRPAVTTRNEDGTIRSIRASGSDEDYDRASEVVHRGTFRGSQVLVANDSATRTAHVFVTRGDGTVERAIRLPARAAAPIHRRMAVAEDAPWATELPRFVPIELLRERGDDMAIVDLQAGRVGRTLAHTPFDPIERHGPSWIIVASWKWIRIDGATGDVTTVPIDGAAYAHESAAGGYLWTIPESHLVRERVTVERVDMATLEPTFHTGLVGPSSKLE